MDNRPVSFPQWKDALAGAALSPATQQLYRREIVRFLRHCKEQRTPVSAALMARYLSDQNIPPEHPTREALRWFYRSARKPPGAFAPTAEPESFPRGDEGVSPPASRGHERASHPPPAALDLGRRRGKAI